MAHNMLSTETSLQKVTSKQTVTAVGTIYTKKHSPLNILFLLIFNYGMPDAIEEQIIYVPGSRQRTVTEPTERNNMKHSLLSLLIMISTASVCCAAGKLELNSEKDKLNYSVGYQIGGDFKKQGVELNPEALVQGIRDALADGGPSIPAAEMRTILLSFKKKIMAGQEREKVRDGELHRKQDQAFLAENGKSEGVKTLASGVQYKVLKEGSGRKPTLKDTVTLNYRGTLIDGTEFDSTYRDNKPRTFPLANLIPGWKEALQLMKEGDKWQVVIPASLAFGESGPLSDRVVIYEMELLSVQPAK